MIDFDDAANAAEKVGLAIAEMRSQRSELEAKRKVVLSEIDRLYCEPLNKSDIKAFILEWIDRLGESYENTSKIPNALKMIAFPSRHNEYAIQNNVAGKPLTLRDLKNAYSDSFDVSGSMSSAVFGVSGFDIISNPVQAAFFYFFGEAIKSKVSDMFDQVFVGHANLEVGTPLEDRYKTIGELESEAREYGIQISGINERLRQLGDKV